MLEPVAAGFLYQKYHFHPQPQKLTGTVPYVAMEFNTSMLGTLIAIQGLVANLGQSRPSRQLAAFL